MTVGKTALVAGVTGQDGAFLSKFLLDLGYRVIGTSRDAQSCNTSRLERLGISKDIQLISLAPNDLAGLSELGRSPKGCADTPVAYFRDLPQPVYRRGELLTNPISGQPRSTGSGTAIGE